MKGLLEGEGQVGRLETQTGFLCCSLEVQFLLWGTSVFVLKVFSGLEEAHPQYHIKGDLLKVNPLQMLATSRKYLHVLCQHLD